MYDITVLCMKTWLSQFRQAPFYLFVSLIRLAHVPMCVLVRFGHMLGNYVLVCGGPEVVDSLSDHLGPNNAAFAIRHHPEDREKVQAWMQFLMVPEETIRHQHVCALKYMEAVFISV